MSRKKIIIVGGVLAVVIVISLMFFKTSLDYINTPDQLAVMKKADIDSINAKSVEILELNRLFEEAKDDKTRVALEQKLMDAIQEQLSIQDSKKIIADKQLIDRLFMELRGNILRFRGIQSNDLEKDYYSVELIYHGKVSSPELLVEGYLDKITIFQDGTVTIPKYAKGSHQISMVYSRMSEELLAEFMNVINRL